MEVVRMRVELGVGALEAPVWPDGVSVRGFRAEDGPSLHALLEHGYRRGFGSVPAYELWLSATTGDAEFDPELCFLADAGTELAGATLCWTSAFVKDLVVRESWRRRGLGEALLRHVFAAFAERGAERVDLNVDPENVAARRLYERVGMHEVE